MNKGENEHYDRALRLTGGDPQDNTNGITYALLAVVDELAKLREALTESRGVEVSVTTPMGADPAAFIQNVTEALRKLDGRDA